MAGRKGRRPHQSPGIECTWMRRRGATIPGRAAPIARKGTGDWHQDAVGDPDGRTTECGCGAEADVATARDERGNEEREAPHRERGGRPPALIGGLRRRAPRPGEFWAATALKLAGNPWGTTSPDPCRRRTHSGSPTIRQSLAPARVGIKTLLPRGEFSARF